MQVIRFRIVEELFDYAHCHYDEVKFGSFIL